jgi:hypothetical protein
MISKAWRLSWQHAQQPCSVRVEIGKIFEGVGGDENIADVPAGKASSG